MGRNGSMLLSIRILAGLVGSGVLGAGVWQVDAFLDHERLDAHPVAAARIGAFERRDAEDRVGVEALRNTIEAGFARMEDRHDALALFQVALDIKQQAILDEVARLRGVLP